MWFLWCKERSFTTFLFRISGLPVEGILNVIYSFLYKLLITKSKLTWGLVFGVRTSPFSLIQLRYSEIYLVYNLTWILKHCTRGDFHFSFNKQSFFLKSASVLSSLVIFISNLFILARETFLLFPGFLYFHKYAWPTNYKF